MDKKKIIEEIKKYLKKNFKTDATGHDWWHFKRNCQKRRWELIYH